MQAKVSEYVLSRHPTGRTELGNGKGRGPATGQRLELGSPCITMFHNDAPKGVQTLKFSICLLRLLRWPAILQDMRTEHI